MTAYQWLGYAGAVLLPAAAGLFAYMVTGRLRPALLACWVSGLWGGLAGYLWLASAGLPALTRGEAPPVIWDDYYEARFLGEYAGPHSEITAYLCRTPFYPREAGLVVFWPALGLIYAGLPALRHGRIRFALLTLATAAVYPYYGIAGLIVLAAVIALEARRLLAARQTRTLALRAALLVLVALGVAGIADFLIRQHKSPDGLTAYLTTLWTASDAIPWYPSLRFRWRRILGGHFFMLAVMGLALWRARAAGGSIAGRLPERLRAWPGWPLFLTSLLLATGTGMLIVWSEPVRRLLDPYGWIVPWRCLVEPVIVLGTALALEDVLIRTGCRRSVAAVLLLIPTLSAFHWTINADVFLRRAAAFPYGRGKNQPLYEEFTRYGAQLLGRVTFRGPVLTPPDTAPFMEAAFGIRAVPAAHPDLLAPNRRSALLDAMARGEIGDVIARSDDPALKEVVLSGNAEPVTFFGPYVVLRFPATFAAASGPRP